MSKLCNGRSVSQSAPPSSLLCYLRDSTLGQQLADGWVACHAAGWSAEAVFSACLRGAFRSSPQTELGRRFCGLRSGHHESYGNIKRGFWLQIDELVS